MIENELGQVDLRALQVLVTTHDAGSFSAASQRLGVNQSTVSYTIQRLRGVFADPLFVRQGNAVTATERCGELVSEARSVVDRMQALATPSAFDPVEARGTITLSCNYHERFSLLPAFLQEVRRQAPHVRLGFLESAVDGKRQLKENASDIVLGPVRIFGDAFFRRSLFTDHYACVMDAANPLAAGDLTLARYRAARHVAITHNGLWEALYFEALRARDVTIEVDVTLPSHDNLADMIAGTDLVATIPNRLARAFRDGLVVRAFPIRIPIEIDMYWTERTHHSGLHRWARQILAEVARRQADRLSGRGTPA